MSPQPVDNSVKNSRAKSRETASGKSCFGDANDSINIFLLNQWHKTIARACEADLTRASVSPSVWTLDTLPAFISRLIAEWRIVRPVGPNSHFP
jgi:hypothetical protein